jgi:hypothetical protein
MGEPALVPTDPTRGGLARCEPNQLTAPSVRRDPGATDATASSRRSAGADESSASSASEHAGAGRRRGGQLAWMIDYPAGYLARRGTDEAAEAEVAPARFFFVWFGCGGGGESASAGVVFVDVLSLPPSACPHSLSHFFLSPAASVGSRPRSRQSRHCRCLYMAINGAPRPQTQTRSSL